MTQSFEFVDPGALSDGEIALELRVRGEADPSRGWSPWYGFAILAKATGEEAGEISLRVGQSRNLYYGGNIGYAVQERYRGRRYAAKACRLLFPLARRHGMESLIITCNPDNMPSRRTCEILGGALLEIADIPPDNDMYAAGERHKCIFRVDLS